MDRTLALRVVRGVIAGEMSLEDVRMLRERTVIVGGQAFGEMIQAEAEKFLMQTQSNFMDKDTAQQVIHDMVRNIMADIKDKNLSFGIVINEPGEETVIQEALASLKGVLQLVLVLVTQQMDSKKVRVKGLNFQQVPATPTRVPISLDNKFLVEVTNQKGFESLSQNPVVSGVAFSGDDTDPNKNAVAHALGMLWGIWVQAKAQSKADLTNVVKRNELRKDFLQKLLAGTTLRQNGVDLINMDDKGNVTIDRAELRFVVAALSAKAVKSAA